MLKIFLKLTFPKYPNISQHQSFVDLVALDIDLVAHSIQKHSWIVGPVIVSFKNVFQVDERSLIFMMFEQYRTKKWKIFC